MHYLNLLWYPSFSIKRVYSHSVSSLPWCFDVSPLFSLKSTCEQSDLLAYDCKSRRRHYYRRYGHHHHHHHFRHRRFTFFFLFLCCLLLLVVDFKVVVSSINDETCRDLYFRSAAWVSHWSIIIEIFRAFSLDFIFLFLSMACVWFGFSPSITKWVFFWLQLRQHWANHCVLKSLLLIDPKTVIVMWLLLCINGFVEIKFYAQLRKNFFHD